ncbi:DUF1611 domain-containing protein [Sinomonas sp. B1-1]|uniref:DUF1611 domain-containing protein n=1 Tax=Sinomonas sp. B1-1 TaxID=3141454 RepID=UPI003D2D49CF
MSTPTIIPVHASPEGAGTAGLSRRLAAAKKAYTTRFLSEALDADPSGYRLLTGPDVVPVAGDIVLTRVERIGQLPRLESPVSRRQALFVGDEVLLAYANRYAPDQVLAEVPAGLGPCHLIAAGGLAGVVTASHGTVGRPTQLAPLGLLADAQGRLNLARFAPRALDPQAPPRVRPHVVAVLGTSMNSGKSTAAACLVRGLTSAGLRVAAGKITGTGAGGDPRLFQDAGAVQVLDFTDYGYPTTFRLQAPEVRALAASMVSALAESGPEAIVVEVADGLYQGETRQLLNGPLLRTLVDTVLFAAGDAVGACAGVGVLRAAGHVPAAVSGMVTVSPLAAAEAAAELDVPVIGTYDLARAETAMRLLAPVPE